jgi:hypothetical protein
MCRFAIVIAIIAAGWPSWTTAAPPARPSGRLQKYDQGYEPAQLRRGGATAVQYQQPGRTGYPRQASRAYYQQSTGARYQQAQPTYHEDVGPGTVVEGPVSAVQGPMSGEWSEGGPWSYDDGYCDACCDDCCSCGPMPGFWGRAEYLYWWVDGADTPPLVTTSPDDTPQAQAGVLPDATVLFGNERVNTSGRSGGRFTLGYWFNCCEYVGVDSTFLFLGNVKQEYFNSSNGSPILARPFFNVDTLDQDAQLIAFPGIVVGSIEALATSRVYGGDVNLRKALVVDCWKRFDVLAGYRYFRLAEGLRINSNTTSIDPESPVEPGTTFAIFDDFDTANSFNGAQLGLNLQMINGCWTIDFLAKLAVGAVAQTVTIDGGTTTTVPGGSPVSSQGGVLALDSNIGTYHRNRFSLLPEFGVDLRYQMTPLWRLNLGYTIMILTNVVRPGDQIDLNIDPNLFPPSLGGTQPRFVFQDSDVWMQGINVGIECNF